MQNISLPLPDAVFILVFYILSKEYSELDFQVRNIWEILDQQNRKREIKFGNSSADKLEAQAGKNKFQAWPKKSKLGVGCEKMKNPLKAQGETVKLFLRLKFVLQVSKVFPEVLFI